MSAPVVSASQPSAPVSSVAGPRFYVGVATRGRPETLAWVIRALDRQTLKPAGVVVACVEPADVAGLPPTADLQIVHGAAGLTRQRNAVLRQLPAAAEYVAFFDDDFLPDERWLEACAALFAADPALACVTGQVLADGILGPGLTFAEAETALQSAPRRPDAWRIEGYSPYGCNMAFRLSAIPGLVFDERLPLYGWLEDVDFGAQVARRGGRLIKAGAVAGVHLGVKRGRVSGLRLGYSQIANPIYLWRKGSMTMRAAFRQIARNVAANLARSVAPEPFIDRLGRLRGNAVAILDLVKGACRPERAERL